MLRHSNQKLQLPLQSSFGEVHHCSHGMVRGKVVDFRYGQPHVDAIGVGLVRPVDFQQLLLLLIQHLAPISLRKDHLWPTFGTGHRHFLKREHTIGNFFRGLAFIPHGFWFGLGFWVACDCFYHPCHCEVNSFSHRRLRSPDCHELLLVLLLQQLVGRGHNVLKVLVLSLQLLQEALSSFHEFVMQHRCFSVSHELLRRGQMVLCGNSNSWCNCSGCFRSWG
mmetsp:Transcript_18676/g.32495  ORF Transcript_18676/g.32495 Transcript_18676/m.32495 type:complete len:222 (-) Transcript_18676:868-1533(-)